MQESKDYRAAQKLSKGEEGSAAFKEVTKKHGLHGKYCLESWANQNCWARAGSWVNDHLDSPVTQKLAIRAGKAMQLYSYHQIGRPRYKSFKCGLQSVEAKTSVSGIRWKGNVVEWKGLSLWIRLDR